MVGTTEVMVEMGGFGIVWSTGSADELDVRRARGGIKDGS